MTCKDCIHYEVCLNFSDLGLGTLNEDECGMFKDKSHFTEDQNCSGIVRCKDCFWWDKEGRCENPVNGLVREYTGENDYCSYARKEFEE